jgi:hypothetical protein
LNVRVDSLPRSNPIIDLPVIVVSIFYFQADAKARA